MSELIMAVALLCGSQVMPRGEYTATHERTRIEAKDCQSRLLTCAYKGKRGLAENLADCVKEKK